MSNSVIIIDSSDNESETNDSSVTKQKTSRSINLIIPEYDNCDLILVENGVEYKVLEEVIEENCNSDEKEHITECQNEVEELKQEKKKESFQETENDKEDENDSLDLEQSREKPSSSAVIVIEDENERNKSIEKKCTNKNNSVLDQKECQDSNIQIPENSIKINVNCSTNLECVKEETNDENGKKRKIELTKVSNEKSTSSKRLCSSPVDDDDSAKYNEYCEKVPLFKCFIKKCLDADCPQIHKDAMIRRLPNFKKALLDAEHTYTFDSDFKQLLDDCIDKIDKNPNNTVLYYTKVFKKLLKCKDRTRAFKPKDIKYCEKLQKAIMQLHDKIKLIEEEEVDFDDDDQSSYIKLDRYRERFCNLQKRLCRFVGNNYNEGRYLFHPLNHKFSNYPEINAAVEKYYKKKRHFPIFHEMDEFIRDYLQTKDSRIPCAILEQEIKAAFLGLGNLIQRRRKSELHECLNSFIETTEDPAEENPQLAEHLQKRHIEVENQIEKLMEEYVEKPGNSEIVEISSESEKSCESSDDSDL